MTAVRENSKVRYGFGDWRPVDSGTRGLIQCPYEHAEICGGARVPGILRSAAASGRGLARGALAPLVRLVPVLRPAV